MIVHTMKHCTGLSALNCNIFLMKSQQLNNTHTERQRDRDTAELTGRKLLNVQIPSETSGFCSCCTHYTPTVHVHTLRHTHTHIPAVKYHRVGATDTLTFDLPRGRSSN